MRFVMLLFLSGLLNLDGVSQEKPIEKFELVRQNETVKLYERWIIFPDSKPPIKAREVKSEFTLRSSMYRIVHILRDESTIKIWQTHVTKFKVYIQPDTTYWQEYSYHDIPWPVSDQDHFLEYQLHEKHPGKEVFITFKSKLDPLLAPKEEDVTRMKLSGSWRLEQITADSVRVTYRILSMPIGMPKFFTDPIIRTNLMSTVMRLKELAEHGSEHRPAGN